MLPQTFDPVRDLIGLIDLPAEGYARAAFLDERALAYGRFLGHAPFAALRAAAERGDFAEACDFIFHLGHVGSTLLSRLVGAHPDVLSLREPPALTTLAGVAAHIDSPETLLDEPMLDARLSVLLRLWSRTFAPDQRAIVKATSVCCTLAPRILARPSRPRAIALICAPDTYATGILSSTDGVDDLRGFAPMRLHRLHARFEAESWRLMDMSPGVLAAMSWVVEMLDVVSARRIAGERLLIMDSDALRAAPGPHLASAFAHFGRRDGESVAAAAVEGPLMRGDSKRAGTPFEPAEQARKRDHARAAFADELSNGKRWLAALAARERDAAEALDLAAGFAAS